MEQNDESNLKTFLKDNQIGFPKPVGQTIKFPEQFFLTLIEGFYNIFDGNSKIYTRGNGEYDLTAHAKDRCESIEVLDLFMTDINYKQLQISSTHCCTKYGLDLLFDLSI